MGLFSRKKDPNQLFEKGMGLYKAKKYEKALEAWIEAGNLGDKAAQFNCGVIYLKGQGVRTDYDKAIMWWEKAAAQGHAGAINNLPELRLQKEVSDAKILYRRKEYEKALPQLVSLAERGSRDVLTFCAYMYKEGLGTQKDDAKALGYYLRAAEFGNEDAMFACGEYYENGGPCEKNMEKALQYYRDAAKADSVPAMMRLGKYYYALRRYDESYPYFKKAVDADNEAEFMEAKMRYYGFGTESDKDGAAAILSRIAMEEPTGEALYIMSEYWAKEKDAKLAEKYFDLSLDKGYTEALFRHAMDFKNTIGGAVGMKKAEEICRLAAEKGHKGAAQWLAELERARREDEKKNALKHEIESLRKQGKRCLEQGSGEADQVKALEFFLKGAELGDGECAFSAGKIYDNTELSLYDPEKAVQLFEKTAELGCSSGAHRLAGIYASGKRYGGRRDQDIPKAAYWYEKAAELDDDPFVLTDFALTLRDLLAATDEDIKTAFRLLSLAAEKGENYALYELAYMHLKGIGTERNAGEAWEILRNFPTCDGELYGKAECLLGIIEMEEDDYMDAEGAMQCFERAVEEGNPMAMARLGEFYLNGWMMEEPDEDTAIAFFKDAMRGDDEEAKAYAENLLAQMK